MVMTQMKKVYPRIYRGGYCTRDSKEQLHMMGRPVSLMPCSDLISVLRLCACAFFKP